MLNLEDGMTIPDFLKRPKTAKKGILIVKRKARRKAPTPPEGPPSAPDRWADASQYTVYLYDQIPVIGCGMRVVWVTEGRKWARLGNKDGQGKISMGEWETLKKKGAATLLE